MKKRRYNAEEKSATLLETNVLTAWRCCQSNRYKSLISTRQAKRSAHPATCSHAAMAADLRSL